MPGSGAPDPTQEEAQEEGQSAGEHEPEAEVGRAFPLLRLARHLRAPEQEQGRHAAGQGPAPEVGPDDAGKYGTPGGQGHDRPGDAQGERQPQAEGRRPESPGGPGSRLVVCPVDQDAPLLTRRR